MKRTVLYARVSYDDRDTDARNLKGQIDMGREYAHKHGWQVVAELAEDDRGASGKDWDLPQLSKALEMARAKQFDILIVRELDRFARSLAKQLIVEQEFQRAGVTIEYVLGEYPDTPEGNLNKNLKAVIAEYERLKIAERMTRGRRLKTKAGSVMAHGTTPFGYRLVIQNNMQALEIHEPEAQTVRLIFTWYTEGNEEEGPMTIRGITRKLHELGMDIPRSTINRILSSETYGGVWHYGKWGSDGKKRFRNPDDHLIAVEVPPIVAPEVVELAMSKRKANKEQAGRKPKYEYLLSGRLICGTCGGKMRAAPRNYTTKAGDRRRTLYYRCNTTGSKEDRHKCSNKTCYRADIADAAVWGEIVKLLQDRERLTQGFTDYLADREIENGPIRERLDVVESLIADNQKQLGRAIDLYLSGDFPKEMLTERKMRLETTIAALEKEQAGLTDRLEARTLTEAQIKSLREFADEIEKKLERANFRTRRGVIETLDVQVTLTLENGKQVAYVHCTLPGQDSVLELSHPTEYAEPAVYLREGRIVEVEPLSELEEVDFPEPIGRLEAFTTGGGTDTMPWTYQGKLRTLENKTLRYPGHYAQLRAFYDLGLWSLEPIQVPGGIADIAGSGGVHDPGTALDGAGSGRVHDPADPTQQAGSPPGTVEVVPRDLFHALFEPKVTFPEDKDLIVVRVKAVGKKDGRDAEAVVELIDYYDEATGFTAMERCTGWSAAIVAEMMVRGDTPRGSGGVEIMVPARAYVHELARRGIGVREQITS